MAKQKGMFPLEGSLGGINFYFRKGKPVARAAGGGFNGDAIKTKPSMERVRENGSEFGMVARAKKLIRLSVAEDLLHAKDGELHGRMMSVLQEVKVADLISERGRRTVWQGLATEAGKKLMTGFLFIPKQGVTHLFSKLPVVELIGKRCVCGDLIASDLLFPKSATVVRLHYFVVDYDVEHMEYVRYSAAPLFVSKDGFDSVVPLFELMDLPDAFGTRMAFLSVQFYQEQNGKLFELKENGMAGVRCLGVL